METMVETPEEMVPGRLAGDEKARARGERVRWEEGEKSCRR